MVDLIMNAKILVMDNDTSNADVIRLILENEDFQVKTVIKPQLFQKIADNFNPDLILMDIMLDGDDGRLLCNDFKIRSSTAHIPVMLITAMLETEAKDLACQADMIMYKPFEYARLVQNVRMLLQRNMDTGE